MQPFFAGRINRKNYISLGLLLGLYFVFALGISRYFNSRIITLPLFLLALYFFFISISLSIRRAHDIGWGKKKTIILISLFYVSDIISSFVSVLRGTGTSSDLASLGLNLFLLASNMYVLIVSVLLIFKSGTNGDNVYGSKPKSDLDFGNLYPHTVVSILPANMESAAINGTEIPLKTKKIYPNPWIFILIVPVSAAAIFFILTFQTPQEKQQFSNNSAIPTEIPQQQSQFNVQALTGTIGQTLTLPNITMLIDQVIPNYPPNPNDMPSYQLQPDNMWLVLHIVVKNTGTLPLSIGESDFSLTDDQGMQIQPSDTMALDTTNKLYGNAILNGVSTQGYIIFPVKKTMDINKAHLTYAPVVDPNTKPYTATFSLTGYTNLPEVTGTAK